MTLFYSLILFLSSRCMGLGLLIQENCPCVLATDQMTVVIHKVEVRGKDHSDEMHRIHQT